MTSSLLDNDWMSTMRWGDRRRGRARKVWKSKISRWLSRIRTECFTKTSLAFAFNNGWPASMENFDFQHAFGSLWMCERGFCGKRGSAAKRDFSGDWRWRILRLAQAAKAAFTIIRIGRWEFPTTFNTWCDENVCVWPVEKWRVRIDWRGVKTECTWAMVDLRRAEIRVFNTRAALIESRD
jgi:hypothetical protein